MDSGMIQAITEACARKFAQIGVMERRCENCEFYYEPKQRCVRFPPQVFFRRSDPGNDYEREFASAFPWVPEPRWCGEFKASSAPAAGGE